jgi:hypothetical protein
MLSEAERKAKCKSFIESSKFGLDTWITIHALDENVKNMIMTITVYRKLIKKLDEGLFSIEFPPAQMLRIKQHIVLDMILKTEIIIESSLIFTYQLAKGSRGYRALPKTTSRYDTNLIKIVKIKVWKRGFPLRTVLRINDNQIMPAFFGDFTDKCAILESIAAKVFPEMNAQSDELYEDFTYKKGHLVEAFRNNTITNAVQRSKDKKNN